MQASALLFATSRPTIRVFSGILPLPSLLVRALTPMQLFGLRKTPDLSLASPQVSAVVATGSGPATGGCLDNRPFANSLTICGHKVARRAGWGVESRYGSIAGSRRRSCNPTCVEVAGHTPIRRHSASRDGRLSTPYGAAFPSKAEAKLGNECATRSQMCEFGRPCRRVVGVCGVSSANPSAGNRIKPRTTAPRCRARSARGPSGSPAGGRGRRGLRPSADRGGRSRT